MATTSYFDRLNAAFLSPEGSIDPKKISGDIAQTLGEWRSRFRYRADLTRLLEISPHLITDIGLKPNEVREETTKSLWEFQAPMHSE